MILRVEYIKSKYFNSVLAMSQELNITQPSEPTTEETGGPPNEG